MRDKQWLFRLEYSMDIFFKMNKVSLSLATFMTMKNFSELSDFKQKLTILEDLSLTASQHLAFFPYEIGSNINKCNF